MFEIDKNLANDCFVVLDLKVCRLLLMNNKNFPWLILVPKINNAIELTNLDFATQTEVLREINLVAKFLQKQFSPYKINIAMLGNMVRQLHIHVVARFENDIAFPRPVWGEAKENYSQEDADNLIKKIKNYIYEQ